MTAPNHDPHAELPLTDTGYALRSCRYIIKKYHPDEEKLLACIDSAIHALTPATRPATPAQGEAREEALELADLFEHAFVNLETVPQRKIANAVRLLRHLATPSPRRDADKERLDWLEKNGRFQDRDQIFRIRFEKETVMYHTLREAIDAASARSSAGGRGE